MNTADQPLIPGRGHGLHKRNIAQRGMQKISEIGVSANATVLLLYVISISWPVKFQLGPVYMTFSRIMIIMLLVPMLARLFSGRAGPLRGPDFFVILFGFWAFVALSANHGVGNAIEYSSMFFIETSGAYLVGRIFIRSAADFFTFIRYLVITVLISLPFATMEMLTGSPVIVEFLRASNPLEQVFVLPININYEPRLGLQRAQFTFTHPILFGVFCSSLMALALTVHTYKKGISSKLFWGCVVFYGTFAALSSAGLLSALLQLGILFYERITRFFKARWRVMAAVGVISYILIDIFASHSPIAVFVSNFSLNPATAWNRLLIWEYGSAEVLRHPIFGIGNNMWQRPHWMSPSVDNHWLLNAMRYGFPGIILLLLTVIPPLVSVGRAKTEGDESLKIVQRGYMAAMIGLCIAMGTVWLSVEVNSYFMTLLAGGYWIADQAKQNQDGTEPALQNTGRTLAQRRLARRRVGTTAKVDPDDAQSVKTNSKRSYRSRPVRQVPRRS